MSAASNQAEPREEGEEELDLPTNSPHLTTTSSDPPPPSSPSPTSSPTQQKRRRYDDETDTSRRDRSDRPDEELLAADRRPSSPPASSTSDPSHTMQDSDDRPASDPSAGAASEEKGDSTELRLLLESNNVGAIIGKGGEVIKKLREEHQVYINILKVSEQAQGGGGSRERVMVLKGSTDTVLRVLQSILELQLESAQLREKRDHGEDVALKDAVQVRLLVHRTTVGAVIGKEGSTIRQTSSSTGARVQVSGEALPHSSEKTVAISGTKEQVNAALALVVEQIKSNPPKPGTKVTPYVPGVYGGYQQGGGGGGQGGYGGGGGGGGGYQGQGQQMGGGGGGYGGQQQFGGGGEGPMTEQKIAIPSVCAGCVIGRGGQIIRDLRTQSNCLINVEKPDPAVPNERVVTIKGTNHAIQTAVYLIRQCVEQYKPREDGRGGGEEY